MAILGIDEVGRGPWAGPLVIGAVVLPDELGVASANISGAESKGTKNTADFSWVRELTDSKKLTAKKREQINAKILESASINSTNGSAIFTGLGWVSAEELDEIGLSAALRLATRRAVENIPRESFSEIIIDGTQNFLIGTDLEKMVSVLPKADAKIKSVSAASIIAKVARDNYMVKLSENYPEYGFEKHVGYGTRIHKEALEKYGPCPEHRKSFRPVAEMLDEKTGRRNREKINEKTDKAMRTTTEIGSRAEKIVADFLEQKGHKIIARNYKTKYYEIDIVSATKDAIYFTEVKYRKNASHGDPLEFVDQKKQEKMIFAAEIFTRSLAQILGRSVADMPKQKLAAASVSGPEFVIDEWMILD